MRTLQLRVNADASGERLDAFLARAGDGLTRAYAQRLIAEGAVLVAGTPSKASYRVRDGDMVEVRLAPPAASTLEAEDIPITVLHEDAEIIVVDKPAGMPVHPSAGHSSRTLVNALLARYPDIGPLQGEHRPGIVHRLDKDTSGVMVVARSASAQRSLAQQIKDRQVEKVYLALAAGTVLPAQALIEAPLGRHPQQRKRQAVVEGGRRALTAYRVLEQGRDAALLEVKPETGRTHQIRVHLAAVGHPVIGDAVYGRRSELIGRQALHALRLSFSHPTTGEWRTFGADPPEDFRVAAEELGLRWPWS